MTIQCVMTNVGLSKWVRYPGGVIPFAEVAFFRVGEGGWADPGTGRAPRVPDPTLTDLDIILDASRALAEKRYNVLENLGWYQKAFVPVDFGFDAPATLEILAMLTTVEYNAKNAGTLVYDYGIPYVNPAIWEIGLYDSDGDMVLYATFPQEIKDGARQLENAIRVQVV